MAILPLMLFILGLVVLGFEVVLFMCVSTAQLVCVSTVRSQKTDDVILGILLRISLLFLFAAAVAKFLAM